MQDLLERMNLLRRYVESPSDWKTGGISIDYQETKRIMELWRTESMDYLLKHWKILGGYHRYLIFEIATMVVYPHWFCGVAA